MHPLHRSYLAIGVLLGFLAVHGSGGGLSAQPDETSAQPRIPMLDEGKGLIHLDVSVTDARGEAVAGLQRSDFELLDEGYPRQVLWFHAFEESNRSASPVQIVLFVDTFGLAAEKTSQMQLAIERFLQQNGGHTLQPVSIFGYSEDGLWTTPHHDSTDGNALASDLSLNRRIVLDRRAEALRAVAFIAATQRRKAGRKTMLWIGPGCGTGTGMLPPSRNEGHKIFDLIYWFNTLFREARLSMDEISFDQESPCSNGYEQYLGGVRTISQANQRFLYKKVLAIQSGGNIEDGRELVAAMNRCVRRAQNFYTLSFDPPKALEPHEYHGLQIRVNRSGLQARTNSGYYDEPFYVDEPNPALRQVTVQQLDQIIRGDTARQIAQQMRGSDSVFASEPGLGSSRRDLERADLPYLELTERVSFARLAGWTARFKSRSPQESLISIADASAFLEPPPEEVLSRPAPDAAAQQQILRLTKEYLEKAVPKLPDFYAMRTTVSYQDEVELKGGITVLGYRPLHVTLVSKARVLYRRGDEVVEPRDIQADESSDNPLITRGTFGPMLGELRRALESSQAMTWVRWETGPQGDRAVFRFDVPASQSKYFEGGCCLPDADGGNSFRIQAGYREEISVDPESGVVFRLQEHFYVDPYVPLDLDQAVIDYGPVEIGGKTYICPVRSVGMARGRTVITMGADGQSFLSWGPYSTKINDMRFSDYHVFRSESHILGGSRPEN